MDVKLRIAVDKANAINQRLESLYRIESFVPLDDIVKAVKDESGYSDITIYREPFSEFGDGELSQYGAMLSTEDVEGKKALIVVNSELSPSMQRFSTAHELGHLITDIPNYETPNDGRSTISTHINSDITYIQEKDYKNNEYLYAEQVANVFALMVLIPHNLTINDIVKYGAPELSKRYGVTEDAVYSRLLLTESIKELGETVDAVH